MSNIASPRFPPSEVSTPTTSRRTSLDFHSRSGAASPNRVGGVIPKRNRAALQAYYGLKSANASILEGDEPNVKENELDQDGFQPEAYVQKLLETEGMEGVLRVESGLLSDLGSLDGEQKALVYDNYSKLIIASDTIRKMRTNIDPLAPTIFNLTPALSHIAESAASLATSHKSNVKPTLSTSEIDEAQIQDKRRDTVKWVLHTPQRLLKLLDDREISQAEEDWAEVKEILEKWKERGVKGAEDLWQECSEIMEEGDEDDASSAG